MRTLTVVTAAALTLAGCATSTAGESSPPLRHVTVGLLPEEPAHDDELPVGQPPGSVDRDDPAAAAVELIAAGLAEQGLEVVDLGFETSTATRTAATVRVAATQRRGETGAPHTSVYEVDLTRESGGTWRLVAFRQTH